MSKPQTPAAPNLVGAAQQTGQSNLQAAIAQALLGHVNQVTPWGSQTWSTGGTPGTAPSRAGGVQPSSQYRTGVPGGFNEGTGGTAPGMGFVPMGGGGNPSTGGYSGGTGVFSGQPNQMHAMGVFSDLNPTRIIENGAATGGVFPLIPGQRSSDPALNLFSQHPGQAPSGDSPVSGGTFDPSQIPQFTETTTLSPQQQAIFDQQQATQGTTARAAGQIAGNINTSPLDFSGAPAMPSGADQNAQLQNVQNALYARQSQYLDPQFTKQQDQLNTQLANQGFQSGDAGVSNSAGTGAQDSFNMAKQKAYADARDSAIAGSSAQLAQNSNTALAQRQQAISETLAQRNQPINELAALGGGGSMGMPSFPSTGGTQGIPGADYLGAAGAQNNANLQNFGIQAGQYNSQLGGLLGLLGSGAMYAALA